MVMIPAWIIDRFPGEKISSVNAGWSDDQKYRLGGAEGSTLLRVSPADAYSRKQEEFTQLGRLNRLTEAFPLAVEHGLSPDGEHCFVRYEWMEGAEALVMFPSLSEEAQFNHGVAAGKLLRMIHALPQTKVVDSYAMISAKMTVRRQQMRDLNLEFEGYDTMLEFLETNLHLVKNSSTAFRHGDFHLGNMLIDPQGELKVIDFNRSDFGDPMEDFNQMFTFSRRDSVTFVRGQLEGYFDAAIPDSFYRHALCYIIMNCAFGLVWSQRFGAKEIAVQHALIDQIMDDFDGLKSMRPKWLDSRPSRKNPSVVD